MKINLWNKINLATIMIKIKLKEIFEFIFHLNKIIKI